MSVFIPVTRDMDDTGLFQTLQSYLLHNIFDAELVDS